MGLRDRLRLLVKGQAAPTSVSAPRQAPKLAVVPPPSVMAWSGPSPVSVVPAGGSTVASDAFAGFGDPAPGGPICVVGENPAWNAAVAELISARTQAPVRYLVPT